MNIIRYIKLKQLNDELNNLSKFDIGMINFIYRCNVVYDNHLDEYKVYDDHSVLSFTYRISPNIFIIQHGAILRRNIPNGFVCELISFDDYYTNICIFINEILMLNMVVR